MNPVYHKVSVELAYVVHVVYWNKYGDIPYSGKFKGSDLHASTKVEPAKCCRTFIHIHKNFPLKYYGIEGFNIVAFFHSL